MELTKKLTKDERQLRSVLCKIATVGIARPGYAYRNPSDFVIIHGEFHRPLPVSVSKMGTPKHCFANAIINCVRYGWRYVEGYAAPEFCGLPFHHAWNLDRDGRAYDCTWPEVGRAYIGVEFSLGRADDASWNGDASVLDDWHRQWPLLKERWTGEDWKKVWTPSKALVLMRRSLEGENIDAEMEELRRSLKPCLNGDKHEQTQGGA